MTARDDRTPTLPCFACGAVLLNVFPTSENQPDEGTAFRTRGHYGSTFWDDFDGEELILNICDPCLRAHTDRLAVQRTEIHDLRPYCQPAKQETAPSSPEPHQPGFSPKVPRHIRELWS